MNLKEWIERQKEIESKATGGPWSFDNDELEIHACCFSTKDGDPWHVVPDQKSNVGVSFENGILIQESRNNYRNVLEALEIAIITIERFNNREHMNSTYGNDQLIKIKNKLGVTE
jgi:hypothetical protein